MKDWGVLPKGIGFEPIRVIKVFSRQDTLLLPWLGPKGGWEEGVIVMEIF